VTPIERAALALGVELGKFGADTAAQELTDAEHINIARAVITAIREPSSTMQRAAFDQKVSFRSGSGVSDIGQVSVEYDSEPDRGAATIWTAMIDALLEEGK
jgi:hypothetical protein